MTTTVSVSVESVFNVRFVLVKPITTVGLTLLLFGFYVLLFGQSFYFLSTRQNAVNRRLHLISITTLFVVATAASFIAATGDVWDSVEILRALKTQNLTSPRSPGKKGVRAATYIGFVATNCIADYVLIYRLFTIWGGSKRVIGFPVVASISANAAGLASSIIRIITSPDTSSLTYFDSYTDVIESPVAYYFMIAAVSAIASVNGMITLMIAGRIWWIARENCRGMTGRLTTGNTIDKEYKTITAIILESGIMYSTILMVDVALVVKAVPVNITPAVILVAGIAPTFVIMRSSLHRFVHGGQAEVISFSLHLEFYD
ncbi:hypothetical protein Moror_10755 [Moniliophthora roreri MCA 2997]|uniref:Uncharacterized protein n=1 Tax=Moniliophthora roreri (strain MCA 2997) TaxID=1381753 RepID=V2X5I9_MONRO|nr:hypothetical protein Moror_10755 [Moniliophthora roreri MCA 2997]